MTPEAATGVPGVPSDGAERRVTKGDSSTVDRREAGASPAAFERRVPTTRVRGRMSATKRRALEELGSRYGLDPARLRAGGRGGPGPVDRGGLAEALRRWADGRRVLLDVGVGRGEATVAWARDHPDAAVLAVELHRPGLAATLAALDAAVASGDVDPSGVRVLDIDVRDVLPVMVPGRLTAVRLLFPDPWPKRRHHDRRLVGERFVATVGDALAVGGILHVATDHPPYAEQVVTALAGDGRFSVDADAPRPPRPVTSYEAMARSAGRPVTEVVATRR